MKYLLHRFLTDRSGQTLTEYALILALIALVAVGLLTNVGTEISDVFDDILTELGG